MDEISLMVEEHKLIKRMLKVAYTFAEKNLSEDTIYMLNKDCESFEKVQKEKGVQNKYLKLVVKMEDKYLN